MGSAMRFRFEIVVSFLSINILIDDFLGFKFIRRVIHDLLESKIGLSFVGGARFTGITMTSSLSFAKETLRFSGSFSMNPIFDFEDSTLLFLKILFFRVKVFALPIIGAIELVSVLLLIFEWSVMRGEDVLSDVCDKLRISSLNVILPFAIVERI